MALAAVLIWLLPAATALAQAPPPGAAPAAAPAAPAAPAGPPGAGLIQGDIETRLHLVLIDQMSYTIHPFFQITEDSGYSGGRATTSGFYRIGTREVDEETSGLNRVLHALPPFGIEGVMAVDLPFPRGFGFGFDFSPLIQTDSDAADAGSVTAIRMGAFYYSAALRFYFFDPTSDGVNYFVGLGLGLLEGTIKVPYSDGTADYIAFSQYPVGSTRLGLETRGESLGFRYELMVLNAEEVELDSNPYPDVDGDGVTPTTIDFSGALVRLSLFFQF